MRLLLALCAVIATTSAAVSLDVRQNPLDPQVSNPLPSQSPPPPPPADPPASVPPSVPPTLPSNPVVPSDDSKPSLPAETSKPTDPPQPPPSQPPNAESPPPAQVTPPPQQEQPSYSPSPTVIQSTDEAGSVVQITITVPVSVPLGSPSAKQSDTPKEPSKGLSTGSIVGMSVAGGIALIGIVGFFVWKLTRKRFNDFDDNEAIKWPELNAHGESAENFTLPTNQTGRAGFGSESEVNLSRTASASTGYGGGAGDPYAVPPLPHANPGQPYRDDPSSPYYDPYRGPIPHTFSDATAPHDNDAIPMSSIRARSPGPAMAFDAGRASPAPSAGRQSPSPHMAYAGPQARTMSPGPNTAYGGYPH